MSKKKKLVFPSPPRFRPSTHKKHLPNSWEPFESYNHLEATQRAPALKNLGINVSDPEVIKVLTKSHFVIPGKTRFECQQCGECCRYARKVAQLTYEPCPFLAADNTCSKHDERYIVCKWFPFWILDDDGFGPLLTIKPYCSGFGKGPLVDYAATIERIRGLETEEKKETDGAFVIHEVLFVPGRKDWAFPSKTNIDALMDHIYKESRAGSVEGSKERSSGHIGEVHYAHHYTSGLLGAINSPLYTVNEFGIITDTNDAGVALLRLKPSMAAGKPFASFFDNPEAVSACLAACRTNGKETASPQRIRFSDGTTQPALVNGITYRDRSDGLVHGSLLCVNPVSAAVFAEVNRNRNYARGLLDASIDTLMVIDKDGIISDVNEEAVAMTGRVKTSLIGRPFHTLFADEAKAKLGVDCTFKNGSVRMFELDLVSASGETIPVSFNAAVYKDSEGMAQGIIASARDIRERLRIVRELEEAKNYSRGLIECCIDLMVTINRDGIITDVNRAATRMTGKSREQIIGAAFKSFFDDPQRADAGVVMTFALKEVRNYDLNLVQASGTSMPVSFNATLYRNSKGDVQGVFAIARAKD